MRRALVVLCACCGCGALSLGLVAGATGADSRLQANKAIARRDTRALLARLRLPHDATRSATEPAGAGSALKLPFGSKEDTVRLSAWWTSRESPAAVLAYLRAHEPGWGRHLQVMTEQQSTSLIYTWTIEGPHLYSQALQVTAATLADGRTGVMVQADSVWTVPRPRSEQLPAGVRSVTVALRIGSGLGGMKHQHTRTVRFTEATAVASLVAAVNALQITQPDELYMCPLLLPGRPLLTLRFVSPSSTLAKVQVYVYPGQNGDSGWNNCDAIQFWIHGKQQTALISRTFVPYIGRLIGTRLS